LEAYTRFFAQLNEISHIADHFHLLDENSRDTFNEWKRTVAAFQKEHSSVYGAFHGYEYLPIQAFKDASVTCFPPEEAELIFKSSGTSGQQRSKHFVRYSEIYNRSICAGFERVFGKGPFILLAHLPAYESGSSLVHMAHVLIKEFGTAGSAIFLEDDVVLTQSIQESNRTGIPIILLGAAFGLLDLSEKGMWNMPSNATIIETGGMKTHRREMSRPDLHASISSGFGVTLSQIRSEYGMCELLSQCYTNSQGLFETPPWMEVCVLDSKDFKTTLPLGEQGLLAVFDLANVFSQCAILTQDLAVRHSNGFEVLGRQSDAEIRGCNLLLEA
jgi:hypothetical protein